MVQYNSTDNTANSVQHATLALPTHKISAAYCNCHKQIQMIVDTCTQTFKNIQLAEVSVNP